MANIQFYNTLTNRIEPFEPVEPGKVSMYNCGPTVYDFAHIGNFKSFLFSDVLRRFLELAGYDVHQVMNLTDVGHMTEDDLADGGGEDKMQVAGQRLKEAKKQGDAHAANIENPEDPYQVAEFYIQAFVQDAKLLGLKVADEYPQNMPRATEHVEQMLSMIKQLMDKGHAYQGPAGEVYFSIESFDAYGGLSGNTLEEIRGGAGGRVEDANQQAKRHPADFLLWKPDASHIMKWDPRKWGIDLDEGYPGWHIECSAMAKHVLKRDIIDIHTGGEDNIFPHHECEIAQTCGCTGQDRFARYWLHGRHLMVEGEKMSKSKGNFFTVRQVLDGAFTGRAVDPAVLRLELIKAKYRSQMNLTKQGMADSGRNVQRLRDAAAAFGDEAADVSLDHPTLRRFTDCLADDLNMAGALGAVFEFINQTPAEENAEARGVLNKIDHVLGVLEPSPSIGDFSTSFKGKGTLQVEATATYFEGLLDENIKAIQKARLRKDFTTSDAIRDKLIAAGYDVKISKEGVEVVKRLA